jgi:DNA-binding transcriptional regulator YhcF (GntR family)
MGSDEVSRVLRVDPDSGVPPFEQVRRQLADAIASGELAPETRLPTIRQVAAELGLAVNTVARAYRELESADLVQTRGRAGTFVVGASTGPRREAARVTREYTDRMERLGMGPAEILALVRRDLDGNR